MKCDAFAFSYHRCRCWKRQYRWALCLAVFISNGSWRGRPAGGHVVEFGTNLGSVQLAKIPFLYFPSFISDTLGDIGLGDGVQSQPSAGCGAL